MEHAILRVKHETSDGDQLFLKELPKEIVDEIHANIKRTVTFRRGLLEGDSIQCTDVRTYHVVTWICASGWELVHVGGSGETEIYVFRQVTKTAS